MILGEQIEDKSKICGISYKEHANSTSLQSETDSSSSIESDDNADTEDNYEDMIWGVEDKQNPISKV